MSYNFKSIVDVEVVAEPTESANILIEEDGVIKKAPKTAVGGVNNNGFIIIDMPEPVPCITNDIFISGVTCNKTFDEIVEMHYNGEIILICERMLSGGFINLHYYTEIGFINADGNATLDVNRIECIEFASNEGSLFYYRNGFSYTGPAVPK